MSIPYKYVVYKAKKRQKYELHYEYIYKLDSNETTNRCLFVKPHLLNDEGRWSSPEVLFFPDLKKKNYKRLNFSFGVFQGNGISMMISSAQNHLIICLNGSKRPFGLIRRKVFSREEKSLVQSCWKISLTSWQAGVKLTSTTSLVNSDSFMRSMETLMYMKGNRHNGTNSITVKKM